MTAAVALRPPPSHPSSKCPPSPHPSSPHPASPRPFVARAQPFPLLDGPADDELPARRPTHPGGRQQRSDAGRRRVCVRPAVVVDPPFDDERAPRPVTRWTDGSLALALPAPEGGWAPRLRLVPPLEAAPRADRSPAAADPRALAPRITIGLLEVLSGGRPLRQLARVMAPVVLDSLERRLSRGPVESPARLVRVLTCTPADGIAEVSAVVTTGDGRTHAVAFRMEATGGSWLVTALETSLL